MKATFNGGVAAAQIAPKVAMRAVANIERSLCCMMIEVCKLHSLCTEARVIVYDRSTQSSVGIFRHVYQYSPAPCAPCCAVLVADGGGLHGDSDASERRRRCTPGCKGHGRQYVPARSCAMVEDTE